MFPDFSFYCFLLSQCTQSSKDVLERALRSLDYNELCPPGTQKTSPLGLEVSRMTEPSPEPMTSPGCSQQHSLQRRATPCPLFSRSNKRDSLHSTNPAFRLASPSPSLSHAAFLLGDSPDVGFVPQP